MTRAAHVLTLLGVIAVPVYGWFVQDWSGATTLVVYWFETLAGCLFISARILVHQRWSPRRGHFRYQGPSSGGRSGQVASFVSGFALVGFAFTAAHGLFLGAIVFLLTRNGQGDITEISWRSAGLGCLSVTLLLAFDFLMDLMSLRRWSFRQLEQVADQALGRVMVIHMTLIFGFIGIAITSTSAAFFGVFVVLKTLAALNGVVPQYQPAVAPKWLSAIMNRVPNVHPGKKFEDFWADDRADEVTRRERNEELWVGRTG